MRIPVIRVTAAVLALLFICSAFLVWATPAQSQIAGKSSGKTLSIYDGARPSATIWTDDFETDKGWTGYSGLAQWGRGTPVEGVYSGSNAIGTNLAGDYALNINPIDYITSPVIDCSGYITATLKFQRFLEVECQATSYDHVYIEAFNGVGWNQVWTNPGGLSNPDIVDTAYSLYTYDVSAYAAGNANFRIRFGLSSDTGVVFTGWNVDDLSLDGDKAGPLDTQSILPATGQLCYFSDGIDINWTISGGAKPYKVNITLSTDGGATYSYNITKNDLDQPVKGNGTHPWLIPTGPIQPSTRCKMNITVRDKGGSGTPFSNTTAGFFTIATRPPSVTVTTPNGGEHWYIGQTYKINWTMGGTWWGKYNTTFFYSTDGGLSYTRITNITKSSGASNYDWAIPMSISPSTTCKIKVNATGGGNGNEDISNNNFTLERNIFIFITSPKFGDTWYLRGTYSITWFLDNGTAPYSVDLKLSLNGGIDFSTTIALNVKQNSSGSDFYSWTVPASISPSPNCKIQLSARDSGTLHAIVISERFYINATIVKPVGINVAAPNGGETISLGTNYMIRWYLWDGVAPFSVDIWLSSDSGANYNISIAVGVSQAANGTGSFDWFVDPGLISPGGSFKVKTIVNDDTGTGSSSDESNSTFGIYDPVSVQLTSPLGAEIWELDSKPKAIAWKSSGGLPPYDYDISLSTDSGLTFAYPVTSGVQSTAGDDSYGWVIPVATIPESIHCRIRVNVSVGGSYALGTSPADFIIVKPVKKIGNVTGTVTCSQTNTLIGGADVSLNLSGFSTTTDTNGVFTLSAIPSGVYTYTVTASGYQNYSAQVTIIAFKTTNVGFVKIPPIGVIKGRIVDKAGSVITLADLKVTLRGSTFNKSATIESGNFSFTSMPLGNYDVKITAYGYKNYTNTAKLTAAGPMKDFGNITLESTEITSTASNFNTTTILVVAMILVILLVMIVVVGIYYNKKKKEAKKSPLQFVHPAFPFEQYYEDGRVDEVAQAQVTYPEGYYPESGAEYTQAGYESPPPPVDALGYESPPEAAPPYVPLDDLSVQDGATTPGKKIDYDAELAKYSDMKKKGTLSDEEYEFSKKNLLAKKFEESKKKLDQKKREENPSQ